MVELKPRWAHADDAAHELLSVDEVNERFPNEWVALRVARLGDDQQITHGYVLAHTLSRKTVSRVIARAYAEDPDIHVFIFVAGTRVLSPAEWQRRLRELPDEPYLNAHW